MEEHHKLDKYLDDFKVFGVVIKDLTSEQIFELNHEFKYFIRKLRIVAIILFVLSFFLLVKFYTSAAYLYTLLIVIAPPFATQFLAEHYDSFMAITLMALFIALSFLASRLYDFIGHYFIFNEIQNLELKNLKQKYEPEEVERPLSPKVRRGVEEIVTLGQNEKET